MGMSNGLPSLLNDKNCFMNSNKKLKKNLMMKNKTVVASEMCDRLLEFQFLIACIRRNLHLLVDDILYVGNESKYVVLQVATLHCISSIAKHIPNLGTDYVKPTKKYTDLSRAWIHEIGCTDCAASAFQWFMEQNEGMLRHKFIENLIRIAYAAVFKRMTKKTGVESSRLSISSGKSLWIWTNFYAYHISWS